MSIYLERALTQVSELHYGCESRCRCPYVSLDDLSKGVTYSICRGVVIGRIREVAKTSG